MSDIDISWYREYDNPYGSLGQYKQCYHVGFGDGISGSAREENQPVAYDVGYVNGKTARERTYFYHDVVFTYKGWTTCLI